MSLSLFIFGDVYGSEKNETTEEELLRKIQSLKEVDLNSQEIIEAISKLKALTKNNIPEQLNYLYSNTNNAIFNNLTGISASTRGRSELEKKNILRSFVEKLNSKNNAEIEKIITDLKKTILKTFPQQGDQYFSMLNRDIAEIQALVKMNLELKALIENIFLNRSLERSYKYIIDSIEPKNKTFFPRSLWGRSNK